MIGVGLLRCMAADNRACCRYLRMFESGRGESDGR